MSQEYNDILLERANDAILIAGDMMEGPLNNASYAEEDLDKHIAQVAKHIDDNNLDDLFNYSLPALENRINYYTRELGKQSQEHFKNWNIISESDTY